MPDFSQTLHRVKLVLHGCCGEHQPATSQDAAARILLQRTHPAAHDKGSKQPVRYCTHEDICTKLECHQSGIVQ